MPRPVKRSMPSSRTQAGSLRIAIVAFRSARLALETRNTSSLAGSAVALSSSAPLLVSTAISSGWNSTGGKCGPSTGGFAAESAFTNLGSNAGEAAPAAGRPRHARPRALATGPPDALPGEAARALPSVSCRPLFRPAERSMGRFETSDRISRDSEREVALWWHPTGTARLAAWIDGAAQLRAS